MLLDNARSAARALRVNKLRSALTMLGIVIGVGAIIAMVAVGAGAQARLMAQIQSLGTNLLMVVPGATTSAGVRSGWGGVSTLTREDAKAIAAECSAVADVAWMKRQIGQVIQGERKAETEVKEQDYYRMERTYGTFFRRLPLPFEIKPEAVKATFADGMLELTIPKPTEAKTEAAKIKIS